MKRLRTLEIAGGFGIGGAEQAVQLRAINLNTELFEPMVVGFSGEGPRLALLRETGIPTEVYNGQWDALQETIRKFAPHVMHYDRGSSSSDFCSHVQRLAREYDVPLLVETNIFGRLPVDKPLRPPDVTVHISLTSMLRCARQHSMSLQMLQSMGHCVIYRPIASQMFHSFSLDESERLALRRELGVSNTEPLACRVSRPDLRKWSQRLELALPRIFQQNPRLRFIFMEAPPGKAQQLQRRFGDRVLCLSTTSDPERLAAVYQASDLMIHSSAIGESFGQSMAEAMHWALPVIVDSTPSMDNAQIEVVDHHATGLIVRSAKGFAAAVQWLAADQEFRVALGDAARDKARKRFSTENIVSQWERLYITELIPKLGRDLPEALRSYADSISSLFSKTHYETYETRYRAKLEDYFGPQPSYTEELARGTRKCIDALNYARQISSKELLDVVRARLQRRNPFSRD